MPLLCDLPPLPWKASRTRGVPIFDSDSEGGVPKFYGDSEGGYAFFTGTFPEKDHPPLREILNSP